MLKVKFAVAVVTALLAISQFVSTAFGQETAVIAPVFSSLNKIGQTYIRFANVHPIASRITVQIYGGGESLGTCSLTIPGKASVQYSIEEIEDCISYDPARFNTFEYYITTLLSDNLYYQSVIWSPTTHYFSNMSSCREPTVFDTLVLNVHTSNIRSYPSIIAGLVSVDTSYQIAANIYDSRNGELMGEWFSPTYPAGTSLRSFQWNIHVEDNVNWFGGAMPSNLSHVNMGVVSCAARYDRNNRRRSWRSHNSFRP